MVALEEFVNLGSRDMDSFLVKHERVVNGLAWLCLFAVTAITALRLIPSAFTGAAQVGDLLFDFAMAYLAAWVFNLLVVELPRRQQRRAAYRAMLPKLERISGLATSIRSGLSSGTGLPISDNSRQANLELLSATATAPPRYLIPEGGGTFRQGTWAEYFDHEISLASRAFEAVETAALLFFGVELHAASRRVIDHRLVTRHALMWHSESGLEMLSEALINLSAVCEELQGTIDEIAKQLR